MTRTSSFAAATAKIFGATVVAATVMAAPAKADVLTFDDLASYGTTVGGTSVSSGQFSLGFYANTASSGIGDNVGQFVTPGTSDCASTVSCPTNDASTYYAALNAGILDVTATSGATISLLGFDASFIGTTSTSSYPAVAAVLGVQGTTADGTVYLETYQLYGPDANGFEFSQYASSTTFSSLQFTDVLFYVFVCDGVNPCTASGAATEQFALDNVLLNVNALTPTPSDVPEPASLALFGLGLAGLTAAKRRRRG